MTAPLRVVFLGTPEFAVPTLQRLVASRHPVVGVVTQPDRPRGRGQKVTDAPVKALAVERGVPVVQPSRLREPEVEATLHSWQPDLAVVAAYGRLIPDHLLTLPRLGTINVHASLLPRYRGAAPVHRAVMAGDPETGVTIMRVIRELDAGAMFATVTRPIGPDETSVEVERALAALGADLLLEVVEEIAAGRAHEEPQDEALATYAPKITKDEGPIEWSRPAQQIHDQVRGLYPWPHAHTFIGGTRVIVLRTCVEPPVAYAPAPGTVLHASRDALHVVTGDARALALEQLQPEGRRPMTAREFLASRPIVSGTRLGAP